MATGHPYNAKQPITAFDVTQDINTAKVNLAVATSTSDGGDSDIFKILELNVSASTLDWSKLARPSNLGSRKVVTMQLSEIA